MVIRLALLPVIFLLSLSTCKRHSAAVGGQPASSPTPTANASAPPTETTITTATQSSRTAAAPPAGAPVQKPGGKVVVDQTAQTIVFCYHRLVPKIHTAWTEITPDAFEAQMKMLKDRGITVISLQDYLAWRRSEKNIPPRCAVITFDDGWKSQYEVAWPIMKKYGYTFTMFIYTEGVAGGSLGGGQAITWEQLSDMRDSGIDIQAHSATHQDLRQNQPIMVMQNGKRTKKRLTGKE